MASERTHTEREAAGSELMTAARSSVKLFNQREQRVRDRERERDKRSPEGAREE